MPIVNENVDAILDPGGSISGTVTDGGGIPLADVEAKVFDGSTPVGPNGWTDPSGAYTVPGLPAGDLTVCFETSSVVGGPEAGHLDQCHSGVEWSGGSSPPPQGVTTVTVLAGQASEGIDEVLSAAEGS